MVMDKFVVDNPRDKAQWDPMDSQQFIDGIRQIQYVLQLESVPEDIAIQQAFFAMTCLYTMDKQVAYEVFVKEYYAYLENL